MRSTLSCSLWAKRASCFCMASCWSTIATDRLSRAYHGFLKSDSIKWAHTGDIVPGGISHFGYLFAVLNSIGFGVHIKTSYVNSNLFLIDHISPVHGVQIQLCRSSQRRLTLQKCAHNINTDPVTYHNILSLLQVSMFVTRKIKYFNTYETRN
jgi:hypothetical protein